VFYVCDWGNLLVVLPCYVHGVTLKGAYIRDGGLLRVQWERRASTLGYNARDEGFPLGYNARGEGFPLGYNARGEGFPLGYNARDEGFPLGYNGKDEHLLMVQWERRASTDGTMGKTRGFP
jgi:hypothetical protein